MSGFRSRFPTVTPWTTDRICRTSCFVPVSRSIASELGRPVHLAPQGARRRRPGGAPGRVTRSGAGRIGGWRAARTASRLTAVTAVGARSGSGPARATRQTGPRRWRRPPGHALAFGGRRAVHRRGRDAGRSPHQSTFTPGSDRAAGPAVIADRTPAGRRPLVTEGSRAGTAVLAADPHRASCHDHPAGDGGRVRVRQDARSRRGAAEVSGAAGMAGVGAGRAAGRAPGRYHFRHVPVTVGQRG